MKKIVVLFMVILMTFSLVACTNDTKQEETAADVTEPNQENTGGKSEDVNMTIAVNAEIISLDPHNISDTLSGSATDTMYESLYDYNLDMELVPALATDYSVSEDGLEYTFKIRESVTFHDGTQLNAEAVKYNFDRVMDEKKNLRRRKNFVYINSTEVLDDYTLLVKLDAPFAPMINRIASLSIISPAALEKYGEQGILTNPVGTGPYTFEEWTPGDKMVVRANPNYWREGPKIDTLTFKPVTENGARIAMLQTGEADYIYPMPTEQVKSVEGDKNIKIIEGPSTIARFAFINMTKDVFSDVKVRQAINYAIDKDAYAKVVKSGYAVLLTSHVPSTI